MSRSRKAAISISMCAGGRASMKQHDLDITISKNGEVTVHVKGAKGKSCLKYAEYLTKLLGKVKEQSFTSEYYEPDAKISINLEQHH